VNAITAIPGVDSSASGAIFKGLAIANDRLYATDFHNNRVDVFDASFKPVTTATFKNPKLPTGYAPFGIQALAGSAAGGPTTTLYFAAGPGDEAHGLFGSIRAG